VLAESAVSSTSSCGIGSFQQIVIFLSFRSASLNNKTAHKNYWPLRMLLVESNILFPIVLKSSQRAITKVSATENYIYECCISQSALESGIVCSRLSFNLSLFSSIKIYFSSLSALALLVREFLSQRIIPIYTERLTRGAKCMNTTPSLMCSQHRKSIPGHIYIHINRMQIV
jgi:hypothetical protein